MGKALGIIAGIIEIAVGTALEFVPGGQLAGTSLIFSGLATEASILLRKTPRPPAMEGAQRQPIPPRLSAYSLQRRVVAVIR